jgi:serine/threonine protein kinase
MNTGEPEGQTTRLRDAQETQTRVSGGTVRAQPVSALPDDARTATRNDGTQTRMPAGAAARQSAPDAAHNAARGETTQVRPLENAAAQATTASFGRGYRLRERYLLLDLIGQGAMGQVWRAKDLLAEEAKDRDPFVAVKVLTSDFEAHPDAFVALHREATRAQKLAHPNIITVYVFDRDERSGRAFIAMELLHGKPLDQVIREAGPRGLPRRQALPIIRGLAEGLAYAHRKGLVHSDFKPANVFLTSDGVPKILDFGIARAVKGLDSPSAALDESGFQGYTPGYAAPEVIAGAGTAEPSTADDVFALGLVAYELVSGQHPFDRLPALEAMEAGLEAPLLRGLSRREARVLRRAVAFERSSRPRDGASFLRELQGVPLIQKTLAGAVAVLILAAAGLWYSSYLDSLPAVPFDQLSVQDQQKFRENVRLGNEALAYMRRTHDITASADAAQSFAAAYQVHEKDPDAVRGLNEAAASAIDWYRKLPDKARAFEELKKFQARSDYYQTYMPLVRAIHEVGGE